MACGISALIENQQHDNAVSHELRTLARLSFELDLLAREEAAPKRGLIIQDMHADIEELQGMVAELLVYARLERPAEESVKLETVDTLDWLKEALALVAFQAEARNVQCHIQEGYPDHIDLHPRYMSRALLNLVQNAVRYADGHVHVSVTAALRAASSSSSTTTGPAFRPPNGRTSSSPSSAWTTAATGARAAPAWAGDRQAGGGQPQWQHRSLRQPAGRRAPCCAGRRDEGTLAPALAAQDADSRRADGCGSADASPSTSTTWPPPGKRRR